MCSLRSHRSAFLPSFLSYILVMLLCLPFASASASSLRKSRTSRVVAQEPPESQHRNGELLVRFRAGAAAQSRTDGFKDWNPRQTLEALGVGDIGLIVKYGQVDGLETAV